MRRKRIKDFRPYTPATTVSEDATVEEIAKLFTQSPYLHHICVVDKEKRLRGLINDKRLFRNIFTHHIGVQARVSQLFKLLTAETSADIMVTHVITAKEDEEVEDVLKTMLEHNLREIPVVNKSRHVQGFLTLRHFINEWLEDSMR